MNASHALWQAVVTRAKFIYAVTSTGIYCRPSCPARRPKREHVRFFQLPELARAAGYRACKRCCPDKAQPKLELIRQLCSYIDEHLGEPLTLQILADHVTLSPSYVQRRFKKTVGISPQAYIEAKRMGTLKEKWRAGEAISGAAYEVGLGPSAVYSRAKTQLGMTPKTYKERGVNTHIRYFSSDCFLGTLLVAATDKGVCSVSLGDDAEALVAALHDEFEQAELFKDTNLQRWNEQLTEHLAGQTPELDLPTDVRATAFQARVWQALKTIPYGETRSYKEVAESIHSPKSVRAVAGACAKNPLALLTPCHRVVRTNGELSGYRWGVERKKKLLEQEAKHVATADEHT